MKRLSQTTQFARDVRRMRRRGKDLEKLTVVVRTLALGECLDPRYRDHQLVGTWTNCRNCHIEPDWVLIYFTDAHSLRLERTGTHSDLFKK
ncbi:MAG: type II toxin-antitoxin system YafQ family toxin [Candidatus Eisenbacteria bacterium]